MTTFNGLDIFLTSLLFGGSSNADFTRSPFIPQNEFSSDSNLKSYIFKLPFKCHWFHNFLLSIERETPIFPKCDRICPVFLSKLFDHLRLVFSLHTLLEICSKRKNLANHSNHVSFRHRLRPLFIFQTQNTYAGG